MRRQRMKDRLVGAAATALALASVVVVLLWWASEPALDGSAPAQPPSATGTDRRAVSEPPPDLSEGETWLGDVVLDAGTVATPDALLQDVRAVGQDLLAGPEGIAAGSLAVDATVPFEVVAAELGDGIVVSGAGRSRATVVRTVELAGRRFTVVGTGSVDVVSEKLVVEPLAIDIGGPDQLSEAIADVARKLVTIEHSIDGLPQGLRLEDVTVVDDGFRASLRGEDVLLGS